MPTQSNEIHIFALTLGQETLPLPPTLMAHQHPLHISELPQTTTHDHDSPMSDGNKNDKTPSPLTIGLISPNQAPKDSLSFPPLPALESTPPRPSHPLPRRIDKPSSLDFEATPAIQQLREHLAPVAQLIVDQVTQPLLDAPLPEALMDHQAEETPFVRVPKPEQEQLVTHQNFGTEFRSARRSSSPASNNGTSLAIRVFNQITRSLPQWINSDQAPPSYNGTKDWSFRYIKASIRKYRAPQAH